MNICKIVNSSIELSNHVCPISKKKLSKFIKEKKVIKLNCSHCFYYPDFIKSLSINNKNIYSYNRCPYCFSHLYYDDHTMSILNYGKK